MRPHFERGGWQHIDGHSGKILSEFPASFVYVIRIRQVYQPAPSDLAHKTDLIAFNICARDPQKRTTAQPEHIAADIRRHGLKLAFDTTAEGVERRRIIHTLDPQGPYDQHGPIGAACCFPNLKRGTVPLSTLPSQRQPDPLCAFGEMARDGRMAKSPAKRPCAKWLERLLGGTHGQGIVTNQMGFHTACKTLEWRFASRFEPESFELSGGTRARRFEPAKATQHLVSQAGERLGGDNTEPHRLRIDSCVDKATYRLDTIAVVSGGQSCHDEMLDQMGELHLSV